MGWSEKYKKSIDCNNPKGFSQHAHCQGRKKEMTEEKKDHEYSMARSELKTVANAVKRLQKKMGKKGEGELKAWVQSKITKAADYIDTAADYVTNEQKELDFKQFTHKTKHLSKSQHRLDPNLDLKQLVHHSTVQYVDLDADGDVDVYDDPNKKVPDENVSSASSARKFSNILLKKQKGELKHTRRGMAYEETKSVDEGLRDWYKKSESSDGTPGWVEVISGEPCAREEGEEGTPKCVSSDKRASMTKKERISAQRRKSAANPNQPEKSGAAKPTYVPTDKPKKKVNEEKDKPGKGSGKKDACYHKVKARYDVWPSAYASGALVRCRKVGATNWGNKSESYEFSNWRDDFRATEYEFIDVIEAESLVAEASFEIKHTSSDVRRAEKKKKINRLAQQGSTEGERRAAARKAVISLPLIQRNHVELEGEQLNETGKKRWKGYKKKGTQTLFGKTYNRCVKEKVEIPSGDIKTIAQKAAMRIDANVDGIVDTKDPKEKNMGIFIPSPDGNKKIRPKVRFEEFSDWRSELEESKIDKDKMKCNEPKAQAVGDSKTGKSHVVKACESGKEKIIRFGQRGVKGSPKKEGESKAYASRRHRFKTRHAKNIAKGKMSAAYWANVTKW